MLSKKRDTIQKDLAVLGLTTEEVDVYLHMCENGFMSALSLSRSLEIGRTKVYRILDALYEKGIVKHKLEDRGLTFGILSNSDLHQLVIAEEERIRAMKERIPGVLAYLDSMPTRTHKKTEILYYHGKKGLEQVTYNSTKAKGILRIYEVAHTMDAFLDHETSETMRRRLVEKNIFTRQLTNARSIKEYTDVSEKVTRLWEVRYVDPKKMVFRTEVMIYDDVYVMYSIEDGDIFCIEIYQEKLAQMQKELFDFVWDASHKMKILTPRGRAEMG